MGDLVNDLAEKQNDRMVDLQKLFIGKVLNLFCAYAKGAQGCKIVRQNKNINFNNYTYLSRLILSEPIILRKSSKILIKLHCAKQRILRRPKFVGSRFDKKYRANYGRKLEDEMFGAIIKPSVENLLEYFENQKAQLDYRTFSHGKLHDYINVWLKFAINQLYFDYCIKSNNVPNGIISIPEHLINYVCHVNTVEELLENIDTVLGKYILGERVFSNCYEKAIYASLKKVTQEKSRLWNPSMLIPDYSNEKPVKFSYEKVAPSSEFILKAKGLLKKNAKIIHQELEMALWERIVNWLTPPKYRVDLSVLFDDEQCYESIVKGKGSLRARYVLDVQEIVLHSRSNYIDMFHEKNHREATDLQNHNIHIAECEYIFEKTKGSDIISLNKVHKAYGKDEYYKPFNERILINSLIKLNPFTAKIYEEFEQYSMGRELLPYLIGNFLLDNGNINWDRIIKRINKNNSFLSIENINKLAVDEAFKDIEKGYKKRFNILCKYSPELGAIALSYMNADF